ncbi:hypothetical protein ACSQ67_010025 [Phaseolus vulgaris]
MGNLFGKNKKHGTHSSTHDKGRGGRIFTNVTTRALPSNIPSQISSSLPPPILYPSLQPPSPPPPLPPQRSQSISKKPSFVRVDSKQSSSVMDKKQSAAKKYALIRDNFSTLEQTVPSSLPSYAMHPCAYTLKTNLPRPAAAEKNNDHHPDSTWNLFNPIFLLLFALDPLWCESYPFQDRLVKPVLSPQAGNNNLPALHPFSFTLELQFLASPAGPRYLSTP